MTVMPPSAYDFSIRESLQRNRKAGLVFAVIMIVAAAAIATYYLKPRGKPFDPTRSFYSDDDGKTYFIGSVYNFSPFDHDGKTAVEVVLAESEGHYFVGYLMRYTPNAQKQLQQKYDDLVRQGLPVQRVMLDSMMRLSGQMELKLPGSGHPWIPSWEVSKLDVRSPSGKIPDRYLMEPGDETTSIPSSQSPE